MARTSTAAALIACAILLAPAATRHAAAQTPPSATTGQNLADPDDARWPLVTLSFGVGPIVTASHIADLPRNVSGWTGIGFFVKVPSALTGSVQVRFRRSMRLEGEVTYAPGRHSLAATNPEYT